MTPAKSENKPADNKSQDEQPVSRSQLKRDAQAIKSLASDLLKLKTSELQHVPLDKTILLAIQEAQEIRSHGARRRQLQYIAKLLRRIDAGIIIEVVNSFQSGTRGLTENHHRIEAWREMLLEKGDAALGDLMKAQPHANAQAIRQLVRNSLAEKTAGKPPGSARRLFRVLRDLDAEHELPSVP